MAGTFAHITLVDTLCQDGNRLEEIAGLTPVMRHALRKFLKFCELGAVSPDCPYLKKPDVDAEGWGNVMHYWKTADFIRRAVPYFAGRDLQAADSQKCLAWLFGYTAHLVTDLTIHPVLSENVGEYKGHEREHRICEMHQDVHIFYKAKQAQITEAEFLKSCGIADCRDAADPGRLDATITGLWLHCLEGIPLQEIQMVATVPTRRPDPDEWFRHYVRLIDRVAEEGGRLLLRSVLEGAGLVYPDVKNLDPAHIENLKTPSDQRIHYEQLFQQSMNNVKQSWTELGLALVNGRSDLFTLKNANLDTGRDDLEQKPVYWS